MITVDFESGLYGEGGNRAVLDVIDGEGGRLSQEMASDRALCTGIEKVDFGQSRALLTNGYRYRY